eukprot:m.119037 g.119037  ORF g.119037 m.119037 type:complete len:1286 (+) comp15581_c0_seq1:90-3947(+)
MDREAYEAALTFMVKELPQSGYLRATRMLITVLHNLYKFPEKEKFRKLKTKNEVIKAIILMAGVDRCLQALTFRPKADGSAYVLGKDLQLDDLEYALDWMVQERKHLGVMEAWELFPQDIECGPQLGSGKFGKVYEGSWNGREVAIKTLRKRHDETALKEFEREASIMKELQHTNVIQLLGVVMTQSPPLVIMELMGACFLDLLKRCQLSEKDVLDCGMQIAAGLEYIHHRGFIHCDIAARNVLVANSGRLVIGDLGLARPIGSKECNLKGTKAKFPIRWTAPEVFQQQILTPASDVWSFGVTIWEIVTQGGTPFEGLNNKEAKKAVKEGQRPSKPADCPVSLYNIMKQCWRIPASGRPGFADIVHELLSLKINLAHLDLRGNQVVKEVNVGKRKNKHKNNHGWFGKRNRAKSSATVVKSEPVEPDKVMPAVLKIRTMLVDTTKTTVTIKIDYADRAERVKALVMKKLGIEADRVLEYCLVEVGVDGIYNRELANDEYPLSRVASPFYKHMLNLYFCTLEQAEDIQACLVMYHQEELDTYKEAMQEFRSKGHRRAAVDMDVVDNSESPSETRAVSTHDLETYQEAETHDDAALKHAEGEDDVDDEQWLEELDLESKLSASPVLARMSPQQRTMATSFKRRRLRNAKSVYEQLAAADDVDMAGPGPTLPEALYESDDDNKPVRLSGARGRGKAKRKLSRKTRSINSRSSSRTSQGSDGSEVDFLAPITLGHVSEKPSSASLLEPEPRLSTAAGEIHVANNDVDVNVEPLAALASLVEPLAGPPPTSPPPAQADVDPFASLADLVDPSAVGSSTSSAVAESSTSSAVVESSTASTSAPLDPLASLADLVEARVDKSTAASSTSSTSSTQPKPDAQPAPAEPIKVPAPTPTPPSEPTVKSTEPSAGEEAVPNVRQRMAALAVFANSTGSTTAAGASDQPPPPHVNRLKKPSSSKLLELRRMFEKDSATTPETEPFVPHANTVAAANDTIGAGSAVNFAGLVNQASLPHLLSPVKEPTPEPTKQEPVAEEKPVPDKPTSAATANHLGLRRLVESQRTERTASTSSYNSDGRFETMSFPRPGVAKDPALTLEQGTSHTQYVASAKLALASARRPASPGELKFPPPPQQHTSSGSRHVRLGGLQPGDSSDHADVPPPALVTTKTSSTNLLSMTGAAAFNRRSVAPNPAPANGQMSPRIRRRSSALSQGETRRHPRSAGGGPSPQPSLATNSRQTTDPELDDMDKLAVMLGLAPGAEPKLKRNSRSVRRASWALKWAEQDLQEDDSDGEVEI